MATQSVSGKQLILERPVKVESSPGGALAKKSSKSALEEKGGTVLLRHPLPKYSFQTVDQRKKRDGASDQKYSQPVANVSPSVRGSRSTEQEGTSEVVTTEKSLRQNSPGFQYVGGSSGSYGAGNHEGSENNLTLQEALESLAFPSPSEKNVSYRSSSRDSKEVEALRKENEDLKRMLETQVASLKKQLDVQLQVRLTL